MTRVLMQLNELVTLIPEREPVWPLTLELRGGQCWGILGPNGAGKTSLLHTLAGLRKPRSGFIQICEKPLDQWSRRELAQRLGLLFQDHHDGFPATVRETALIGRHPHLHPLAMESATDHTQAETALRLLGLETMSERLVSTLSGGERQRLAIATLLTQNPDLWLLDEPTNHLDLHHQIAILDIISDQVQQGRAAMLSMHDVNLAARYCDHILLLYPDGEACWGPTQNMLEPTALERLYQQPLMHTVVNGTPVFLPAGKGHHKHG